MQCATRTGGGGRGTLLIWIFVGIANQRGYLGLSPFLSAPGQDPGKRSCMRTWNRKYSPLYFSFNSSYSWSVSLIFNLVPRVFHLQTPNGARKESSSLAAFGVVRWNTLGTRLSPIFYVNEKEYNLEVRIVWLSGRRGRKVFCRHPLLTCRQLTCHYVTDRYFTKKSARNDRTFNILLFMWSTLEKYASKRWR